VAVAINPLTVQCDWDKATGTLGCLFPSIQSKIHGGIEIHFSSHARFEDAVLKQKVKFSLTILTNLH